MAQAVDLKGRGLRTPYSPIRKDEVFNEFRNADPDDAYTLTVAGPMCIVYNTEQVTEAEAPKNWPDLLDPNWKGKVAIGHPGFSGYVGIWAVKRSEEHTSELQSLMRNSYAVLCLKKKTKQHKLAH